MLNYSDIQIKYNELYLQLSKYFWAYPIIDAIADLEGESYKIFPDMSSLREKLYRLGNLVQDERDADEDLDKAYREFCKFIESEDTTYAKLNRWKEVLE